MLEPRCNSASGRAVNSLIKLPMHAIGVGEGVDDLQPFDAHAFARAIAGIEEEIAA